MYKTASRKALVDARAGVHRTYRSSRRKRRVASGLLRAQQCERRASSSLDYENAERRSVPAQTSRSF
jgi:hypothetical protein